MIKRELGIFLIVGFLTVAVDFLSYRGLIWIFDAHVDIAKAIGFLTGTIFAYFANRAWTFGHKPHAPGSVWRFVLVYGVTLAANVGVNSMALKIFSGLPAAVQASFLIATAVSATLNFLGMKIFVFKSQSISGIA